MDKSLRIVQAHIPGSDEGGHEWATPTPCALHTLRSRLATFRRCSAHSRTTSSGSKQKAFDRRDDRGHDEVVLGVFQPLVEDDEGFTVKPESFVGDGDTVISVGWYEGLCKATGKVARARFAHVWTLRDGKVARFEQIVDSATFNAAVELTTTTATTTTNLVRGAHPETTPGLQGVTISASTMSGSLGVSGWSESGSR